MKLEIAWESHPAIVLELGDVDAVPDVGDFVEVDRVAYPDSERLIVSGRECLFGYVRRRRFSYRADVIVVRVWIHEYPLR